MEIYGKFMGNFQEIYGKSMGNLWEIYGKFMGNLWEIYGTSMDIQDQMIVFLENWKMDNHFHRFLDNFWEIHGNRKLSDHFLHHVTTRPSGIDGQQEFVAIPEQPYITYFN